VAFFRHFLALPAHTCDPILTPAVGGLEGGKRQTAIYRAAGSAYYEKESLSAPRSCYDVRPLCRQRAAAPHITIPAWWYPISIAEGMRWFRLFEEGKQHQKRQTLTLGSVGKDLNLAWGYTAQSE